MPAVPFPYIAYTTFSTKAIGRSGLARS